MQPTEHIKNSLEIQADFKAEPGDRGRYTINNKNYKRVLIHNAPFLFTCDEHDKISIKEHHSVIIEGDTIVDVLPADKVNTNGFDVVYDAGKRGGIVITPGLINTHSHSHQYLMRSSMQYDEGESIDETVAAWAAWQQHETDEAHAIALIGDITEQQKHGITTTLTHGPNFAAAEEAARITRHHIINAVSAVSNSRPDNTPEMAEVHIKNKSNYHSTPAVSLHYLYKASRDVLEKVRAMVEQYDILLTFHMAESSFVEQETIAKHGMRETALLKSMGLLNSNTLASHVLHVNDAEIKEIAQSNMGIAHLPTSNTIHKSGSFAFWKFEEAGAFHRISLGTDSVVSKSRLDLLTEAYQTRITHLYDRTVKFSSLFKMMTTNGAHVLHEPHRGRIIKGAKADMVFWKLKDRGFIPYDEENPVTLLGNIITHGGRYVRDLLINGRFVIKDRRHQCIDESKLLEETQKAHMEVRRRVQSHNGSN